MVLVTWCVYNFYVYLCIIVSLGGSVGMYVYLCIVVSLGRQCEHAYLFMGCCEPWKCIVEHVYLFVCCWEPLPGIRSLIKSCMFMTSWIS